MGKRHIKIIILAVFIIAAVVGFRLFGLAEYLDPEALKRTITSFGPWGPVVYILLYSVGPSFMLPGLPITIVGGVLFGPFWGVVYVAVGSTVGASVAFLVARSMGRGWVEGFLRKGTGSGRLARLDTEVREKGWKIVAFTRLIPLFPYNVLNYAFGLTSIGFAQYAIATFVFMLPGIIAYVVFSSSILDLFSGRISGAFIIGLALIIIVALVPILYKRYKKNL